MSQAPLEKLPSFSSIEKAIFHQKKDGTILIGGVKLTPELRELLKEQAKYIETSQLWEILNASFANEAIDVSLIQSSNFDHVQFGKALWHLSSFMRKIIQKLSTAT